MNIFSDPLTDLWFMVFLVVFGIFVAVSLAAYYSRPR